MQLSHRPSHFRQSFNRSRLRAFVLITTVITFFITPFAAHAQTPNSFWIPPYQPQEVPTVADVASSDSATVDDALRLIVDTDPGVDDAVALAWLLNVVQTNAILGIVTVAGNTTVENATANVYTVLSWMDDPDVQVVEGSQKPMSQKLSATGKLIHGQDGLWGQQLVQTAEESGNQDARNFYCSTAKDNPGATILALGPLTNLARAIRHCRNDMQNYARIVILGGAKFGGNTTPVAEFNFWQDPEAAQIVLGSGLNIDMVPQDAFTQFSFSVLEVLGDPGDPNADPPVGPTPSIFAGSALPVFQNLAFPVAIYAQTQLAAGVPAVSIPDLSAAIYAVFGSSVVMQIPNPLPIPPALIPAITPALINVIDKPAAVRGQSIIGLGFSEKLTMIATDKELDDIADGAFPSGSIFPDFNNLVYPKIFAILARVPDNANVVTLFDIGAMRSAFNIAINASAAALDVQPGVNGQALPESIYLPSVTGD